MYRFSALCTAIEQTTLLLLPSHFQTYLLPSGLGPGHQGVCPCPVSEDREQGQLAGAAVVLR